MAQKSILINRQDKSPEAEAKMYETLEYNILS